MRKLTLLLGSALITAPIAAATVTVAPAPPLPTSAPSPQLGDADRAAYAAVFAAIRAGDWNGASGALDALPAGPLTPLARAELYIARGAPAADVATLAALLATAPDLPEAPALARLARARGAADLPALPPQRDLIRLAGASKRAASRPTRSDAAVQTLALQVQPLLKAGDPVAAEPLVEAAVPLLTPEATTEWRQRVAWAWFQSGDDSSARRVAALAQGGAGAWAVDASWVAGLAAWRMADYPAAADAFARVAGNGSDAETRAAGLYWAARSDIAGAHPERVAARLRTASRMGETFYGMLAGAALGLPAPAMTLAPDALGETALLNRPNLRAAAALVEIGETALADQLLRHQARIGPAPEHAQLIRLASRLGLPATQVWLAQNAPAGTRTSTAERYPMPGWSPSGGWRVDRALLFAHALQESQLRTDAVSRTGARGLMQLMPGTARLVARHKGETPDAADRMGDPALNFEYGQSYLEELAGHAGTGGLLPKVIAAYNAGPNNVALWNLQRAVQADPLLFIEAIPFGETRAYVAIVLRNYWMYQRETATPTASLTALAQGRWPRFPTVAGRTALHAPAATTAAD